MSPRPFLRSTLKVLDRLRRDRRGVSSIVIAMTMVSLLTCVALASNVAEALTSRTQLSQASDAAVLSAMQQAIKDYQANPNVTVFTDAIAAGNTRFTASTGNLPSLITSTVPSTSVTRNGLSFTVVVSYTATFTPWLSSLLSTQPLTMTGASTATETLGAFTDIQILIDNSMSMLIGEDDSTRGVLELATTYYPASYPDWGWSDCTFACHWNTNPVKNTYQWGDFYGLSQALQSYNYPGYNGLKYDIVKSNVNQIVNQVAALQTVQYFRIGLYTFNSTLTQVYPLGAPSGAVGLANNIMPDTFYLYAGAAPADTFINTDLPSFASTYMTTAGTGATQAQARKFVFLITDGLSDTPDYTQPNDRSIVPFNPASCDAIKATGATLMVLQVTNNDPNNTIGENATYAAVIPLMQQCASAPGLYYQADNAAAISQGLNQMLQIATAAPARFTE